MLVNVVTLIACCLPFFSANANSDNHSSFLWPNNAKIAVSLSYDDALESQLEHAIPVLNHYKLHGSFYLTMNANSIMTRLENWRAVAQQGHELGNHTLFHYCSGSLANREWVKPHLDLDKIRMKKLVADIQLTNAFLHAIDGEKTRTYTAPCSDEFINGKSYYSAVEHLFIGMKTHVLNTSNIHNASLQPFTPLRGEIWAPHSLTGAQLIAHVNQLKTAAIKTNKALVANITFHGIGGDYLSISAKAHKELIGYLAKHPELFWVDTYRNISRYYNAHQH